MFSGRQIVDDEHLVSLVEQQLGQVRPDEPRAAGNQSTHRSLLRVVALALRPLRRAAARTPA